MKNFIALMAGLLVAPAVEARTLSDYDSLADYPTNRSLPTQLSESSRAWVAKGAVAHQEPRLGVPTFLWAPSGTRSSAKTFEAAAGGYLRDRFDLLGLDLADGPTLRLHSLHDLGSGAVIAKYRQEVSGIPVFRHELSVVMKRDAELVAISGFVAPHATATVTAQNLAFRLGEGEVVAHALTDLSGVTVTSDQVAFVTGAQGGYKLYKLRGASGVRLLSPARTRKVYFLLPDRLEPAYYVELDARADAEATDSAFGYVVSARDGSLLYRNSQIRDAAFSYRVWVDTNGVPMDGPMGTDVTPDAVATPDQHVPPFVAPALVTVDHGPISTQDPWLAAGATVTTGNNVEAFSDVCPPDDFQSAVYYPDGGLQCSDLRAGVVAPGSFDRAFDTSQDALASTEQVQAAVAQMFYDVNYFHDWYYDVGFREIDGNAQASNLGRGGLENDSIFAEGEDFSGTNNANMLTPSDGARPRMRQYIFDGVADPALNNLTVNSPAGIAGQYTAQFASSFGAQQFNTTGDLVWVDDGTGAIHDGCEPPTNNVAGKIAFVDRGTCTFTIKAANAQAAGAIGVVIGNTSSSQSFGPLGGTDPSTTIPVELVNLATASALRTNLVNGPVNATMLRTPAPRPDGTVDNSIVAHEWGHYINHRLLADSNGQGNQLSNGMGEGWADTHAMLLVVRPEDVAVPTNTSWNGVYPLAIYSSPAITADYAYFGIRRYPYSTDMTKNALTFKHIQDGVALPTGVPAVCSGAACGLNSEVHNTGEVWASMLWECYAALLRDTTGATPRRTFQQAQDQWRSYLVAAYKVTPVNPTMSEARDALLAVAAANDLTDLGEFWQGFAKRGLGVGAVDPGRYDQNAPNDVTGQPLTESFVVGGDAEVVSVELAEGTASCDADGVLDDGETGLLKVRVKNLGSTTLVGAQVAVTTTTSGVTFPSGNTATISGSFQPFTTVDVTIPVSLSGLTSSPEALAFTLQVNEASIANPRVKPYAPWANYDLKEFASTTESVEALTSTQPTWAQLGNVVLPDGGGEVTPDGGVTDPWSVGSDSASAHYFHGTDSAGNEDLFLVSPPLQVAASGTFSFTFQHRYALENQAFPDGGATYFDSANLELSNDNGQSWVDIGASATPGYNGTVYAGSNNPQGGKQAWVGQNASLPNFDQVAVDLGTTYAGQTVLLRFRVASDQNTGVYGWDVDNIAFTGLANTPFNTLAADDHVCLSSSSSSSSGATSGSSSAGSTGSSTGASSTGSTSGASSASGSTGATGTAGTVSGSTSGSTAASSTGSTGGSTVGSTATGSTSGSTSASATSTGSTSASSTSSTATGSTAGSTGTVGSTGASTASSATSSAGSTGSSGTTGVATSGTSGTTGEPTTGSSSSSGSSGTSTGSTGATGSSGSTGSHPVKNGGVGGTTSTKGCGCTTEGQAGFDGALALLAGAALLSRRRRTA